MTIRSLPAFLLSLFVFIYIDASLVQGQSITGLELIPENPANTDEVIMVVHTAFPFNDCRLDSITPYYACGAFSFNGFYNSGFDQDSCVRSDTVSLGVLSNGMYVISYRMYYLGWSQVDQADTFIVVGTTGLDHLAGEGKPVMEVWPNPSAGPVNISITGQEADRIMVHALNGRFIMELNPGPASFIRQNKISLQTGTYICSAYHRNRLIERSVIVVVK